MKSKLRKPSNVEDLEPKTDPKAGTFLDLDPRFVGGIHVAPDRPTESLSLSDSKVR